MDTKQSFIKTAVILGVLAISIIISPKALASTCTDTDGGQNFNIKGNVNLAGYGWDYCSNSTTLMEQDCGTDASGNILNYGRTSSYTCPNGCSDGACITNSIKVISPNGGEQWEAGKTYNITWASTGYTAVRVNISCEGYGSGAILNVPSGATGGSYSYTVPVSWAAQSQCKAQVSENVSMLLNGVTGVNYDMSDNYFSIAARIIPTCDKNNYAAKCNGATATVTPNYSPYLDHRDANLALDGDISTEWMGTWDTNEATVFTVKMPNKIAVNSTKIYFDSSANLPYKPSDPTVSDDAIFLPKELQIDFNIAGNWVRMVSDSNIRTKGWRTYSIMGDTDEIKFTIPDTWAWNKYPIINEINVSGSRLTPSVSPSPMPTPIPTIKVVSPSGGEQWARGNTYEIKWMATGMNFVNIILYKGNNCSPSIVANKQVCGNTYELSSTPPTALAINVPNNGVYKWTVPATIPDGSDYRMAIQYPNNLPLIDQSDMPFSIVAETPPAYCYPNGTLIKLPGDPKIYVIIDCQKKWIQTIEEFQKNNYSWSDVKEGAPETVNSLLNYAGAVNNQAIADGAIIQVAGDPDVYIVKYVGAKKFKRLILSPFVFRSYGHLKWANIIKVDQSTLDSFITSNLVKSVKSGKIYSLNPNGDTGVRRFIKDIANLQRLGYSSDSVYDINGTDENSYSQGQDLQ